MKLYFALLLQTILCLTIFVHSRSASTITDMKYIKMCNETSPISLQTMNEVFINKKLSGKETSEFKCFLHCLFTLYGWMDEDGGFLLSEMRIVLEETSIDAQVLEFVLFKCTASDSVDRCQRAFQFTECFWHKVKDHDTEEEETFIYNLEHDMV